ncbi:MAG: copper-binding protein, partial [Cyanobacteria bacterium M_surface_10_m2_179]|nr:copper-binding protein [Cyanobacteria bacterium M_surface_10_m2_179]
DQRRRAIHNAWLRGQRLPTAQSAPPLAGASAEVEPLIRLAA